MFPNVADHPNMLYVVSSALPPDVAWIVRAAQCAGAQVFLNQNGVAYPAWHGPGWRLTNRANAWIYTHADFVFHQSDFCRMAAERFLGPRRGPSEILHNPVDTSLFTPRDDGSRRSAGPVLLAAGSHQDPGRIRSAIETLVEVRQRQPHARLIAAGRFCWQANAADACAEATAWAHELHVEDSVEFRGPYTQHEAPALMRDADILLHTKYNDPCPRVVVEAMACGVPVAASASGGIPELIGEEGGIGVPAPLDWERNHPPGPEALAGAIDAVWEDWPRFSAAARQRAADRFDVRPWTQRHGQVFQTLLRGEQP